MRDALSAVDESALFTARGSLSTVLMPRYGLDDVVLARETDPFPAIYLEAVEFSKKDPNGDVRVFIAGPV